MNAKLCLISLLFPWAAWMVSPALAGTLAGHVRDPNWYARRATGDPFGVGYYEYAANANGTNLATTGGFSATDVFGAYSMANLPAGSYTVASWDVWWRSAYAFNVSVPSIGSTADVDVRLQATMWGYPAFWDDAGYYEFGQTFVASGPVSMIYLRDPLGSSFTRTVTLHTGGPGGPQIGATRTYGGGGDQRLIYGYGDMPTVKGQTCYLRLRTPSPATSAVLMQMDPRPDFSDPMPGGCLYLGNGTTLTPHPDRDLGVVIMADDDGLITDLYARSSGSALFGVTSVGQSFVARGVNLISAAFWLADPSAPTYVVRLLQGGPGGASVGTTKRGKPARLTADPEMIVTWAPGECPIAPGQAYYLEVTKDGGGAFNSIYANRSNPFPYGQAYTNGVALSGVDLAGTIMEEESPGAATRPAVRFLSDPSVSEAQRGTNGLTITWTTDVPSDSLVEYALDAPPYTHTTYDPSPVVSHSITLSNLQSHAMYHFRVASGQTNYRAGVFRDQTLCTRPAAPNLLANPGFEEGAGPSPRSPMAGWTTTGLDVRASDGTWFGGLPPHTGSWLAEGAVNAGSSDGYLYQRVTNVVPGKPYTFSAWVTTWPRENDTWKYDVWQSQGRLICMRLGIDPTGGTNPTNSTVRWTPRMYSHLHYTHLAKTAAAQGNAMTVFVSMKGDGVQWHLYGIDDCALSTEEPRPTEPFDSLPLWDSSFDAPENSAASFSVVEGGQSGTALQATRSDPGSSSRVLLFPVQTNTDYALSIDIRCPASPDAYTALTAFRPGFNNAQDLDTNAASWTALADFSNPGQNGNGALWASYGAVFTSGSSTQVSVGFKITSATGTGPAIQWDNLRLEPFLRPVPVLALAQRAANTVTLTFNRPVHEAEATNLANYSVTVPGTNLPLAVLNARLTNGTNVILTTGPQASRANYVLAVSNVTDVSQGSSPAFFNGQVPVRVVHNLMALDAGTPWKFNESGANLGTAWRLTIYNDASWPSGAALFGYETCVNCLPDPIRTPLTLTTNKITFYFRNRFTVPTGPFNAPLRLRHVIDDGAVFYLNGSELYRVGMTNPITYTTFAARTVGDASLEGPFDLPAANLLSGTNVLAVEVHQVNATSTDLIFGTALDALLLPSQVPVPVIPLVIRRQGGQVVLIWEAAGMHLETAGDLRGPWTPVPGSVSPHTNTTVEPMQFFRLSD
jgi:hypothetical protein